MSEAEQRREARRRRILENADARIGRILGTEDAGKSDPGLEDGALGATKSAAEALSEFKRTSKPPVLTGLGQAEGSEWEAGLGAMQHMVGSPTSHISMELGRGSEGRGRWWVSVVAGLLLRLLWMGRVGVPVILPWLGVEMVLEGRRVAEAVRVPPRGPLVDVLLFAGASQPLVKALSLAADSVFRVALHTALMILSFLILHLAIDAFTIEASD